MNVYIVDAQIRTPKGINQTRNLVVQTLATDDTEEERMNAISSAKNYLADQECTLVSIGVSGYTAVIEPT